MEYTELQQNPNPYSNNPNPNSNPNLYTTNYSIGYPYQPNTFLQPPQPQPPGVDPPYVPPPVTVIVSYGQQPIAYHSPYVPTPATETPIAYQSPYVPTPATETPIAYQPPPYVPTPAIEAITYEQQQPIAYPPAASASTTPNYLDPIAWAAAVTQYGAFAAGVTEPNPAIQSHRSQNWKKGPKKIKIVQSAWCEICKIDCNSKDVLDKHKLGKKHLKNLEKLKGPTTTIPPPSVASASVPPLPISYANPMGKAVIGPEEKPNKATTSSSAVKARKKAARTENLETKRRKVLDGGAAAASVRSCNICNVVCNSDTVFNYHLAGKSHAAMIKKHLTMA